MKNISLIILNISQSEKMLNCSTRSFQDIEKVANEILSSGVKNVLIKGKNFENDTLTHDYWTDGADFFWLSSKKYQNLNSQITENIFSSSINACVNLGCDIKNSIIISTMRLNRKIRLFQTMSHDPAWFFYSSCPEEEIDLPYLAQKPTDQLPTPFPSCGSEPLGLYPIVDSIDWIKKLLPVGVKTLQLRIKNKFGIELENEIRESINLAKKYQAKLFINDHWELALALGAYGVHLGQEDLKGADISRMRQAGLRLGVSTHCYYEIARAHALNPSYVAIGPIFPTKSKEMPFSPQGTAQLKRWRKMLHYPLVAIGGINTENLNAILQTNVDGVAMISTIIQDKNPIITTKNLLNRISNYVADT